MLYRQVLTKDQEMEVASPFLLSVALRNGVDPKFF